MRMRVLSSILIGTLLIGMLTGCGTAGQTQKEDTGKENLTQGTEEALYEDGDTKYLFRVQGKYFQKYNGTEFEDYYIQGVNIGSSKPNTYPGELGVTRDEYLDWFQKIGAMHANTIRVYTVMMPAFYEALYYYNTTHEEKLYVF